MTKGRYNANSLKAIIKSVFIIRGRCRKLMNPSPELLSAKEACSPIENRNILAALPWIFKIFSFAFLYCK